MPAILFGSISTVADTSEMQREAFNDAFAAHGLDWRWEQAEYRQLLTTAGGVRRIEAYAASTGDDVDAVAVHATKSKIFQERVAIAPPPLRPGVAEVLAGARARQVGLALVTTTSRANVAALLGALEPEIGSAPFDVVVDRDSVDEAKPDPACYLLALERLGVPAGEGVAIEDNADGIASAVAAHLATVAFPNVGTAGHTFTGIAERTERLDLDALLTLAGVR